MEALGRCGGHCGTMHPVLCVLSLPWCWPCVLAGRPGSVSLLCGDPRGISLALQQRGSNVKSRQGQEVENKSFCSLPPLQLPCVVCSRRF